MRKFLISILVVFSFSLILVCACVTNGNACTYTIEYSATDGGYIVGETTQKVESDKDGSAVTAIPNDGYKFVKWSDDVFNATRQEKNVTKEIAVIAIFEKINYILKYETDGNGTISGKSEQIVDINAYGETVTAIPNKGYIFEKWSDGLETAERKDKILNWNNTYTAIFKRAEYKIRYDVNMSSMGKIEGWYDQKILYGEDAQSVTAIAFNNYIFIKWSDGVITPTRQDTDISEDLNLVAYFGCRIDYKVNNNVGGKLKGETCQKVMPEQACSKIEVIADEGYVFCGWSDLSMSLVRRDLSVKKNFEYMAYFEPIEKTYKYDYGISYGTPAVTEITLNRNSLLELKFVIPELNGYKFVGWYADKDYKVKVVNENGTYMLGYYGLTLDTDTLFARWELDKEPEVPVQKILITYVDEVHSTLKSSKTNIYIEVDYKMPGFERVLCSAVTDKMQVCLNQWFDGKVKFEIDSYYTLIPVDTESFESGTSGGSINYTLDAKNIPEMYKLNNLYHSVLTAFCMNDYQDLLHFCSGVAGNKYGCIYIEEILASPKINDIPLHKFLQEEIDNKVISYNNTSIIRTFLHEYAHTCHRSFESSNEIAVMDLHDVLAYYIYDLKLTEFDGIKDFLLRLAEIDGNKCGIPWEYWVHEFKVHVDFKEEPINFISAGKIVEVYNGEEIPNDETFIGKRIEYGGSLTVKAIPFEGYRFVRWTDGVTTATRTDDNIISYLTATAIFERITE